MEKFELTRDKNVIWYDERPDETQLTPAARQLIEVYSKIPAAQVEKHVVSVQQEAWEVFPYPCIGQYRFLELSLKKFDEYPGIVRRLQRGERLLDMGCCFGQEIRQLVADGAPAENIYGCDLREEYIKLGYKLFCDRDTLKAKFITANILDDTSALADLKGNFDIIFTGSFFHLWDYEGQVKVSKVVADLLRPQSGSMILGRQVGAITATQLGTANVTSGKMDMFQHSDESFKAMWERISQETGVQYAVDTRLEIPPAGIQKFNSDNVRRIWFTVTRQ
ncbi:hypothetical protein M011DRAFT_491389 [Sporormia fimetaria CBS 119925]|uniref:Methyltransferase domain-containing protein n=1 Tax=Sporormia fimetaria CBS 119925 TaxID=1340428 RepID=A0A6A6VPZ6_9PLEO|nr:hypothetical protein M011DRAFT_491389 [Sporormia fimetaria CBS 119925]